MKKLATLTAAIALAAVFGFAGPAKADKPVDGKHHHAYFEATFVEFDGTDEVPGDDTAEGGPGNDLLEGGPGIDNLVGGLGFDICLFDTADNVEGFVDCELTAAVPEQVSAGDPGAIKGRVTNAATGDKLVGVDITVDGTSMPMDVTANNGRYSLSPVQEGLRIVTFDCNKDGIDGFDPTDTVFVVGGGTAKLNFVCP